MWFRVYFVYAFVGSCFTVAIGMQQWMLQSVVCEYNTGVCDTGSYTLFLSRFLSRRLLGNARVIQALMSGCP